MRKTKLMLAIVAMAWSAGAAAMPAAVPDSWWGNMMFRLGVMSGNPGFCQSHPSVRVC